MFSLGLVWCKILFFHTHGAVVVFCAFFFFFFLPLDFELKLSTFSLLFRPLQFPKQNDRECKLDKNKQMIYLYVAGGRGPLL